jgi:ketosteroid isomerase-like protein
MSANKTTSGTAMTTDVLAHHLDRIASADLDGTMADYTDESALFTPDGLLLGTEAIRGFFAVLLGEFAKPGLRFEVLRQEVLGDTAYLVWNGESADNYFEIATDTFIVQDGKIRTQTFAGKLSPKH